MNLAPLLGNWYGNTAHVFLFTYAFKFAKLGGLNQGVIPIMTIFASIFNSIAFYLAFGEIISMPKIFGMIIACSCVVFLSLDSAGKKEIEVEYEEGYDKSQSVYAFFALGLAFLVPIGFSLKHFCIRKYKGSYDSLNLPLDSGIFEMLFCCIFSVYYQIQVGFTARDFFLGGVSGVLQLNGRIFMALGVSEGLGGPAQSLMSTNAVVMTVLTCIVDKQPLTAF